MTTESERSHASDAAADVATEKVQGVTPTGTDDDTEAHYGHYGGISPTGTDDDTEAHAPKWGGVAPAGTDDDTEGHYGHYGG